MYSKTARKCAIFGVCCEGIQRQVNYLIKEASDTGKGANTVANLLHHFLGHHALGEVEMGLHVDNCSGQNNMVLWVSVYLQVNYAIGYFSLSTTVLGMAGCSWAAQKDHHLHAGWRHEISPDCCFRLIK